MEELIPYYDPVAGAVLRVPKSQEADMREAGYTVGPDADKAYAAQSYAATGVAALTGAAHGITFGLSDIAADYALNDNAKQYIKLANEAHPYVHGGAEFGTGMVAFGGLPSMAKRIAGAAVEAGLSSVHADKEAGAPVNLENMIHSVGLGTIMGGFAEGASKVIQKSVSGSQWARNKLLDRARSLYKLKRTAVKAPSIADDAVSAATKAGAETHPFYGEAESAVGPVEVPAAPDAATASDPAFATPDGIPPPAAPAGKAPKAFSKRTADPRSAVDRTAFQRSEQGFDRDVEAHLRSIMNDGEGNGLLDYQPGEYVGEYAEPAPELPSTPEPAPEPAFPAPTSNAAADAALNSAQKVGKTPKQYIESYVNKPDNALLGSAKTLGSIGGFGLAANSAPGIPFAHLAGAVGAKAWALGRGLRAVNEGLRGAVESQEAQNKIFEAISRPAWDARAKLVRSLIDSGSDTLGTNVFGAHDVDQAYDTVADAIPRMAANPEVLAEKLQEKFEPALGQNNEAHSQIVAIASNAVNHLAEQLPKDPRAPTLQPTKYNPPRSDKVKVLRAVQAINDPIAALQNPSIETVQAVEKIYPNTLSLLRQQLTSELLSGRKQYTPEQAKRISIIMGTPLNSGLDPAYLGRMQEAAASYSGNSQAPAQKRGPGRPPKATVNRSSASSIAPPSQENDLENAQ